MDSLTRTWGRAASAALQVLQRCPSPALGAYLDAFVDLHAHGLRDDEGNLVHGLMRKLGAPFVAEHITKIAALLELDLSERDSSRNHDKCAFAVDALKLSTPMLESCITGCILS